MRTGSFLRSPNSNDIAGAVMLKKNGKKFRRGESGFTVLELLVVMLIFMVVMIITTDAFKTIINQSSQQSKSVESQIQGIVGLELLRSDIEQAGFGLPWSFQDVSPGPVEYQEVVNSNTIPASFWPSGVNASSLNDAPSSVPRAIISGMTTFNKDSANIGSVYLAVKSTIAATNDTVKKWTTISFNNGLKTIKTWGSADRDFKDTEMITILKNAMNTNTPTRQLMATSKTAFSSTFSTYSSLLKVHNDGEFYSVYGVATSNALRMPFNRADFYIMRPADKMPKSCMESPGVGVLYKSTVIHGTGTSAGGLTIGMPLLDCVADMQVVYGLDTAGTGINAHIDTNDITKATGRDLSLDTADSIRNSLREVRIYILAQEGKKDRFYTYPSETIIVGEDFGGTTKGRVFNLKNLLGDDYKYFRWKVYTIVLRPKNLGL